MGMGRDSRKTRFSLGCPPRALRPPTSHRQGDSRLCLDGSTLSWVPAKICQSCWVRTSCQNWGSESQDDHVSSWGVEEPATPEGCWSQSEDLVAMTSLKSGP